MVHASVGALPNAQWDNSSTLSDRSLRSGATTAPYWDALATLPVAAALEELLVTGASAGVETVESAAGAVHPHIDAATVTTTDKNR